MTNEEAISIVTTLLYNQTGVMGNNQRIGVFMAIEALKKEAPMKRTLVGHHYVCANCGTYIMRDDEIRNKTDAYCCCCGQSIDWSEE